MTLPRIHASELGVTRRLPERPYMQPGEQDIVLALVESIAPRTMVEIGCNIGFTARDMLRHVPSIERYIGIDVDDAYQFEIPAQQVEWPDQPGFLVKDDPRFRLLMRGDDLLLPQYASCDVVFIDGDHGRKAVWRDSLWAAELVRPGGLIIFHDYGNPTVEVTEVLDALHAGGRNLCHVEGTWLAFERR